MISMKPYIPEPCHEDWNAMTPKEQGRFCDVCAKVVVDFTTMSDEEIINYLQQHSKQKICGLFSNEQLYQAEKLEINLASIPTNLSFKKYFAIALLIAFTSFGLVSCKTNSGRTVGKIEVIDSVQKNVIYNSILGDTVAVIDTPKRMVEGEVCLKPNDSLSNSKINTNNKVKNKSKMIDMPPIPQEILQQGYTTGIMIAPTDSIQK